MELDAATREGRATATVISLAAVRMARTSEKMEEHMAAFRRKRGLIVAREGMHYGPGKFMEMARAHVADGFQLESLPILEVTVNFRDVRPSGVALALIRELRGKRFKITKRMGDCAPWATKRIDLETARALFEAGNGSPYGARQRSRMGFGQSHDGAYDAEGVGFTLWASGRDRRRPDGWGNIHTGVTHIIDEEVDMTEVEAMYASIVEAVGKLRPRTLGTMR